MAVLSNEDSGKPAYILNIHADLSSGSRELSFQCDISYFVSHVLEFKNSFFFV